MNASVVPDTAPNSAKPAATATISRAARCCRDRWPGLVAGVVFGAGVVLGLGAVGGAGLVRMAGLAWRGRGGLGSGLAWAWLSIRRGRNGEPLRDERRYFAKLSGHGARRCPEPFRLPLGRLAKRRQPDREAWSLPPGSFPPPLQLPRSASWRRAGHPRLAATPPRATRPPAPALTQEAAATSAAGAALVRRSQAQRQERPSPGNPPLPAADSDDPQASPGNPPLPAADSDDPQASHARARNPRR